MKIALRIVGGIVVVLILFLAVSRVAGFEPKDCQTAAGWACQAPGLWLRGTPVATPVTDWSFTNSIQSIKVQTETPVMLPYSVNAWCAVYNGGFYVTSYRGRRWVEDIVRDPHVRLKIGDKLYDTTFTMVNDPAEKAAVLQAKGKKYPKWKVPGVDTATVFHVTQS
jgi:hypothetical protein